MNRPIFKPHYDVTVIPGEGALLLSEEDVWALHGKMYELLVPLIDGTRDADELADTLAGKLDGATVYYALALLEKHGHLTESAPDQSSHTAAFWHSIGIEPHAAVEALRSRRVQVRAVGGSDAAPLRKALTDTGIVLAEDRKADLDVVVTDDYLREELAILNAEFLLESRPWLLLKPLGNEPWLGPVFVPGKTACYCCLATRLARNRPVYRFLVEKNKLATPVMARAGNPLTANSISQLAAIEVAKFLAGAKEGLENKVMCLNVRTWRAVTHVLFKDPACRSCSENNTACAAPVELVSRKVTYVQDGGHRTQLPEQTLKRYQHLISPITGVVTTLAPVQDDGVLHVYAAGHNHAFKMDSLEFLKVSLRNASCGKGFSDIQAKVSALCEAIERYSGERMGTEVVMTASFREMRERLGSDAIHPNEVMRFSDRQFTNREAWNSKKSRFNRVAEPLDESVPINWTPVWSLSRARYRYLPTQLLYYRSKARVDCDALYSLSCSNGSASGNNLEEAVLQGFCELVERDAVAIWWYNRLQRPGVAVETFDEPSLNDLINHYKTMGREAWALDITSDLGIPAFAAVSRLHSKPEEHILLGLGCHLDARIALQRAFAELNQMLGVTRQNDDGELAIEDEETLSWLKTATLSNHRYLAPDETATPKQRNGYPCLCTGDLLEDILVCRKIVEERGMELLVLDQTRPDVDMPVVKVIVPGLRHFWARFGPGRLYEVPVRMGWREQPLAEEELNPNPIFF